MPGKQNFFEKMALQIPLEAESVAEYYSLSTVDQEILADDCRKFMEAELEALRSIPRYPGQPMNLLAPVGDPQRDLEAVQPHKKQLKKSYTPSQSPGIRRVHSGVRPEPMKFDLRPGRHSS